MHGGLQNTWSIKLETALRLEILEYICLLLYPSTTASFRWSIFISLFSWVHPKHKSLEQIDLIGRIKILMLSFQKKFEKQNSHLKDSRTTNFVLKSKVSLKPGGKAELEVGKPLQILTQSFLAKGNNCGSVLQDWLGAQGKRNSFIYLISSFNFNFSIHHTFCNLT